MNLITKKIIKNSILALVLGIHVLNSGDARAISPGLGGAPIIAVIALGYGSTVLMTAKGEDRSDSIKEFMASLVIGAVALDVDGRMAFSPLDAEEAKKVGLSEKEAGAYNNEIDVINLLREEISDALGNTNNQKEAVMLARSLWLEKSQELSPDALSALEKISTAVSAELSK